MTKQLKYTGLFIEGFKSYGNPIFIPLNVVGLNLIKGTNGSGKSTLINALLWCEFGVNLTKTVEPYQDTKPKNYQGTRVMVVREDEQYSYMVARHLNYTGMTAGIEGGDKLMLFKKPIQDTNNFSIEHLVADGLHKRGNDLVDGVQDLIIQSIGVDAKTYQNCLVFGQNMMSMITMPNKDKREWFEELFDAGFVEVGKEFAKAEEARLEKELFTIDNEVSKQQNNIVNWNDTIERNQRVLDTFEKEKQNAIAEYEEKLSVGEKELEELRAQFIETEKELTSMNGGQDKLTELRGKVAKCKDNLRDGQAKLDEAQRELRGRNKKFEDCKSEISAAQNRIDKIKIDLDNIETECPYCNSPLDKKKVEDTKKGMLDKTILEQKVIDELCARLPEYENFANKQGQIVEDMLTKISLLTEKVRKASCEYENFDKSLDGYRSLETKVGLLEGKISNQERINKQYQDNIDRERAREMPKDLDIQGYKDKIVSAEDRITELTTNQEKVGKVLNSVQWWIKKGFSSSGLKAYLFSAMLTKLNRYAALYANELGFKVEFTVDMTKKSKPFQTLIYKGDKARDYEDLSGGQKKRADIVIAFALHDLISDKVGINILYMDEIMDALDVEGRETAMELIELKAEKRAVYLITHQDILTSKHVREIELTLDDNGNTLVVNG